MEYMKVSEAAAKWGISTRRVRLLCAEGRIAGVVRQGNLYMIPLDASRPADARLSRATKQPYSQLLSQVDQLKEQLAHCRPLSPAEVDALREMFIVEHTYNSNAIEGNTLTLQETALVLQGITIDRKPLKDHLEVVGYKEAFEYVEQLAKEHKPMTEYEIRTIHSLVLADRKEDRGQWRRVPVRIVGAAITPVQPCQIEPMVGALLAEMDTVYRSLHVIQWSHRPPADELAVDKSRLSPHQCQVRRPSSLLRGIRQLCCYKLTRSDGYAYCGISEGTITIHA